MPESNVAFDAKSRLAEAEELLAQANALAARFSATESAIAELSSVWSDPQAAEYRTKFEESRSDVDAFVKGSAEYVAFLRRLVAAAPPHDHDSAGPSKSSDSRARPGKS